MNAQAVNDNQVNSQPIVNENFTVPPKVNEPLNSKTENSLPDAGVAENNINSAQADINKNYVMPEMGNAQKISSNAGIQEPANQKSVLSDEDIQNKINDKISFSEDELKAMDVPKLKVLKDLLVDMNVKEMRDLKFDEKTIKNYNDFYSKPMNVEQLVKAVRDIQADLKFGGEESSITVADQNAL